MPSFMSSCSTGRLNRKEYIILFFFKQEKCWRVEELRLIMKLLVCFHFLECMLVCMLIHCTGIMTNAIHKAWTSALSVCSMFSGNVWFVLVEEIQIRIRVLGEKPPCLPWGSWSPTCQHWGLNLWCSDGKPVLYQLSWPESDHLIWKSYMMKWKLKAVSDKCKTWCLWFWVTD